MTALVSSYLRFAFFNLKAAEIAMQRMESEKRCSCHCVPLNCCVRPHNFCQLLLYGLTLGAFLTNLPFIASKLQLLSSKKSCSHLINFCIQFILTSNKNAAHFFRHDLFYWLETVSVDKKLILLFYGRLKKQQCEWKIAIFFRLKLAF